MKQKLLNSIAYFPFLITLILVGFWIQSYIRFSDRSHLNTNLNVDLSYLLNDNTLIQIIITGLVVLFVKFKDKIKLYNQIIFYISTYFLILLYIVNSIEF